MEASLGGAALAGLLSFFSPCILPMVPFYLSYLAGLSTTEVRQGSGLAPGARRRLIVQAAIFALGVTTVFVMLGLGATAAGRVFVQWRGPLTLVAAIILAVFGLHFLGLLRIGFLGRELRGESRLPPTGLVGAYAMGFAFGFGWTPCVGPTLAAVLTIAAGSDDFRWGGMLLLVFGLAMTLPFVVAAAFSGPFLGWVSRRRAMVGRIERATGVLLIVFALLIATGSVNRIADWLIRTFEWSAVLR